MKKLLTLVFSGVLAIAFLSATLPLVAAPGKAAGTFKVSPSGDLTGATDWLHIMAAFNQAKAAGPGSTVQITAGNFYVNRPIEVADFSGTVCGAGKDLTRLHTAPGALFGLQQNMTASFSGPSFMVIYFDDNWPAARTADVTVAGLSFYLDGPTQPWLRPERDNVLWFVTPGAYYNEMNVVQVGTQTMGYSVADTPVLKLNVTYQHLKAVGLRDPAIYPDSKNMLRGFLVGGPATGRFIFGDIEVSYAGFGALAVENVLDSIVKIGGDGGDQIITHSAWVSIDFQDISNSFVEVSHLSASGGGSGGINIWQATEIAPWNFPVLNGTGVLPKPSSWNFHHNRFDVDTAELTENGCFPPINVETNGVWAGPWEIDAGNPYYRPDWTYTPSGPIVISHNDFHFADNNGSWECPVNIWVSGSPVLILENKFSGTAMGGVFVDCDWNPESDWLIVGNDFKDFTPFADWAGCDILLTPNATDCTVIGRADTTVWDWGTDNHLIGVTKVQ